jgi:ATP-dependent Clp protease adaptor protein ClpS
MTAMAQTLQNKRTDSIVKKPSLYKVVFNNDDSTPMEFVIDLLKQIFHKSHEDAVKVTLAIHEDGKGTAGLYTFEIAEQKQNEAVFVSRTNGHPLAITLEIE